MKHRLLILSLVIVFIASQLLFGQNIPGEKKDTNKVEKAAKVKECEKTSCKHEKGKTCPKCEGKNKKKCCKGKKCCDKCTGEKCDGKCCAKCKECKKECAKKCANDSTAKAGKQEVKDKGKPEEVKTEQKE
jgi:hypothetical protein